MVIQYTSINRSFILILLLIFCTLFSSEISFAQERILVADDFNNSGARQLTFADKDNREKTEQLFKKDLKRGRIFLLLQGGIAPVTYTTDDFFQRKYKVYYYDFGCTAPDEECIKQYNHLAFNYLNKAYGNKWLKDIRKDVIGLKDWRRLNPGR